MQPGVLERDRQAQAGAAGRPGARGIRPPEAVEDEILLAGGESHAIVPDRNGHGVPVGCHGDDGIPVLAVLHRVDQEIPQDALDPAPVGFRHAWSGRQPELDHGTPALG
jgi:hypothetical protein